MLEFASIAIGIDTADAMVKAAPVASITAGTVHPGKYLVLVHGDTAAVEIALDIGRAGAQSEVFLPDVAPAVPAAMTAGHAAGLAEEAVGVVETSAVTAAIAAADAGVKAADVVLATLRLADGLGGKGYLVLAGTIAEVEAATEAAVSAAGDDVVAWRIVPSLHREMADNLAGDVRFGRRLRSWESG